MDSSAFVKELLKYPKEVILKTVYNKLLFRLDDFVREIQWNDIQERFNKLMAQSEAINKKTESLIGKKDSKSFHEYLILLEKDQVIQKKIDLVMKEMSRYNGRDE